MLKSTFVTLILPLSILCLVAVPLSAQQPTATDSDPRKDSTPAAGQAPFDAKSADSNDASVRPTVRLNEYGDDSPALVRLRKALKTPVTFNLEDIAMREIISAIEKKFDIAIRFDAKALADDGIDVDAGTVSLRVKDVTLGAALDNLFLNQNLAWVIRHEALLVTTTHALQSMMETRIYDVTDFVRRVKKTGQVEADFEPLQDAVVNGVEGPWEEVSGDGGLIVPLEADGIYVLIVYNNPRCHERVEAFLTSLRMMKHGAADLEKLQKKSRPLIPQEGSPLERAVTRISPLTAEELQLVDSVVQSNNRFAADLYRRLAPNSKGNVFLSPYSISTALAMTSGGARGQTARQIHEVLQFKIPEEAVHARLKLLQRHLTPGLGNSHYKLHVANALWCQQDYQILESFEKFTRDHYGSKLGRVNFIQDPTEAVKSINDWVDEQTQHLIPALVGPDDINPLTRLILTNAIYFEATWKFEFSKQATRPADFDTGTEKIPVPTMHQVDRFRYAERDKTQILELSYQDADVSMLVLLPPKGADIRAIAEKRLSPDDMKTWSADLETTRVSVALPKFRFRNRFELKDVLRAMGIIDAFTGKADFSGVDPADTVDNAQFELQKVIHEAFVDVDEKGTKAAAATAIVGGMGDAGYEPDPVDFIADHPFLFLIRENETGCILFVGVVMNPLEG